MISFVFIASTRRYYDHVRLLVGLFIGWFVCYACCDFSESASSVLVKFVTDGQHLCQISLLKSDR